MIGFSVQAQMSDAKNGFASFFEQYSNSAPGGSDFGVAALKSMLAAASTAYDSFNKVAKQTTDFATASNVAKPASKKAA